MYQYATVSESLSDLKRRGYTEDFNLKENCLICNAQQFNPADFEIKEVYRFEGPSDPADEAIVYGIESANGLKGVLVNGYGYTSEPMTDEMARKLRINVS